ncbi:MAG: ABC transporter ATP-binding protein [Stellaceae bacterium]
MSASAPLLLLDAVSVAYGRTLAVQDLSLEIRKGEVVALLGANGAGKTSTLRCISGLLRLRAGSITFDGQSLSRLSAAQIVRHGISHVPEGRRVFPRLSIRDNLELGGYALPRRELERRIANVYEIFPVLSKRAAQYAATLSGGEQQMLAIGRALMAGPKLLLLDEPSLGLAPLVVEALFERIKEIMVSGVTLLLVEQNARLALDTADRAYVLECGRLVCSGTAAAVAADPAVQRAYLGDEVAA